MSSNDRLVDRYESEDEVEYENSLPNGASVVIDDNSGGQVVEELQDMKQSMNQLIEIMKDVNENLLSLTEKLTETSRNFPGNILILTAHIEIEYSFRSSPIMLFHFFKVRQPMRYSPR